MKNATQKERVELLFYVDDDDPKIDEYKSRFPRDNHYSTVTYDKPRPVGCSWNVIAEKCTGDVMIMGNDDLVYKTQGWDIHLENRVSKFDDEIYLAWFNDKINQHRHCAFPIVSRKWYDTLGYFTPGIFEFLYNDTWLYDIGRRVDRCAYMPHVVAQHLHFSQDISLMDETYARVRRDGQTARDKRLYENTENSRINAANKLREVMVCH
jgi:glycosyl transferase/beta-hydroxylase protein BlmF